jgi:hypothetical protein
LCGGVEGHPLADAPRVYGPCKQASLRDTHEMGRAGIKHCPHNSNPRFWGKGASEMCLLNIKNWWFFASIVWRVFDHQDSDMFGHYGDITIRVPWSVAWDLAFRKA